MLIITAETVGQTTSAWSEYPSIVSVIHADKILYSPDGRTDGWLNKGENSFESIGQVKRSEHYDRASEFFTAYIVMVQTTLTNTDHRWADVNGKCS